MKIKHKESLLVYDCELLFEAKDFEGRIYIVNHTEDLGNGCKYLAVPVKDKTLLEFKAGRIDLRTLLLSEGGEEWYTTKITTDSSEITLERQAARLSECAELPEEGFRPNLAFTVQPG